MRRILLSDVDSLVFFSDAYTQGRRSSPIPQLQCEGRICRKYKPEAVECKNIGGHGSDILWKCSADLPSTLRFGKIDVSCEGWSRPGDNYVLEGSCGLKYDLVRIPDSLHDEGRGRTTKTSDMMASALFGIAFCFVLAFIMHHLLKACSSRRQPGTNGRLRPDPQAPGGFSSPHGGDGSPPPYTPYDKPLDSNNAWGPGFWTGLGLGGIGAYLFNRNQRRNSFPYQADQQRSWDWERPGHGSSTFQTRFASPNEGFWSSSRSGGFNDRGEGTSNLGTMRSSSGIARSSVR